MSKTAIQTVTVTSGGVSTLSFSSIPTNYDHLELLVSARCASTSSELVLTFNSAQSNWSTRHLGAGGSVFANNAYQPSYMYLGGIASSAYSTNSFSLNISFIRDYAGSSAKLVSGTNVSLENGTSAVSNLVSGLWNSSGAVTSIQIFFVAGSAFEVGTSATLYGITSGSDGTTTVS